MPEKIKEIRDGLFTQFLALLLVTANEAVVGVVLLFHFEHEVQFDQLLLDPGELLRFQLVLVEAPAVRPVEVLLLSDVGIVDLKRSRELTLIRHRPLFVVDSVAVDLPLLRGAVTSLVVYLDVFAPVEDGHGHVTGLVFLSVLRFERLARPDILAMDLFVIQLEMLISLILPILSFFQLSIRLCFVLDVAEVEQLECAGALLEGA